MMRSLTFLHARIREAALGDAPDEIADLHLRCLARAVQSLPDGEHEVFRLARYEGHSHGQIAERLCITECQTSERFVMALLIIGRSMERQKRRRG